MSQTITYIRTHPPATYICMHRAEVQIPMWPVVNHHSNVCWLEHNYTSRDGQIADNKVSIKVNVNFIRQYNYINVLLYNSYLP